MSIYKDRTNNTKNTFISELIHLIFAIYKLPCMARRILAIKKEHLKWKYLLKVIQFLLQRFL